MVKRLVGWSVAIIVGCAGLEVAARVLGRASTRSRVAPGRALLVYDDDCGLCSRVARFVARGAAAELELVGFSALPLDGALEGLSRSDLWASAHFVSAEGVEYHGGESVTQAARLLPGGRWRCSWTGRCCAGYARSATDWWCGSASGSRGGLVAEVLGEFEFGADARVFFGDHLAKLLLEFFHEDAKLLVGDGEHADGEQACVAGVADGDGGDGDA